jgi:hypothetical protein
MIGGELTLPRVRGKMEGGDDEPEDREWLRIAFIMMMMIIMASV